MFVYDHVQNNVPYTLWYLFYKQYLLKPGALLAEVLLAGALLTAHFKLDLERNFDIDDLNFHYVYNQVSRFPSCLAIQLSRVLQHLRCYLKKYFYNMVLYYIS